MINVNKFENRIVKFKRIDSEGNESDQEAEIRRMDFDQAKIYHVPLRLGSFVH